MFVRALKTLTLVAAASITGLAADSPKPACNTQNYGRLWPEAANDNPRLVTKLTQCGELQICNRSGWHYRWASLAVRVDQLKRGKKKPPRTAACEAALAEAEQVVDSSQPPATN
jgi:hypothetical protein